MLTYSKGARDPPSRSVFAEIIEFEVAYFVLKEECAFMPYPLPFRAVA